MKRNRGNFPTKGKDGVCRVQGCRHFGKYFRRIDNHLSTCHKGISRGMNDRKTLITDLKQVVDCQVPGCLKQVLHLRQHLKNVHNMTVEEHTLKFSKENRNEVNIGNSHEQASTNSNSGNGCEDFECVEIDVVNVADEGRINSVIDAKGGGDCRGGRADEDGGDGSDDHEDEDLSIESDGMEGDDHEDEDLSIESDGVEGDEDGSDDHEDEDLSIESDGVEGDGDGSDNHEDEDLSIESDGVEGDGWRDSIDKHVVRVVVGKGGSFNEGNDTAGDVVNNEAERVEHSNYNEHLLRYLIHNSSKTGIYLLLHSMNRTHSLTDFFNSIFCKEVFGHSITISTLRDIYMNRKFLLSYYRWSEYHPGPDASKWIHRCLACATSTVGQCTCPVLPKSFYLFCRQKCHDFYNCQTCKNFNNRASHLCFDFFHCKICDEQYKNSCKYQPYPTDLPKY